MDDIVAKYPYDLEEALQNDRDAINRVSPDHFEEGFVCIWNNRFYIHTRATLPLKDIDSGIGFGLWVQVSKEDYDKHLTVIDNNEEYEKFSANGILANNWPGFENTLDTKVIIRTVRVDEKVYITEVLTNEMSDPLFYSAINVSSSDIKQLEMIKNLVTSYVGSGEIF